MESNRYYKLFFEDCLIEDNYIFFFEKYMNGLFSMNIESGEINFIGKIPNEQSDKERLCVKIIKNKDEFILVPMDADDIWIFNVLKKEWKKISICLCGKEKLYGKFAQAIKHEDKVYMIGTNYPAIITLDLQSYCVEYNTEVYASMLQKKEESKDCLLRSDYVIKEEYLYMASCVSNQVLKMNLLTGECEWICVGNLHNRYAGIAWDGIQFWLAPRGNTKIVKWDGKKECLEFDLPEKVNGNKNLFLGIIFDGKQLCIPGMGENKSLFFENDYVENMKIKDVSFLFYKRMGNYVISLDMKGILHISKDEVIIWHDVCKIEKEELIKHYEIQSINQENRVFDLQDVIYSYSFLMNNEREKDRYKDIGQQIYQTMKRACEE